MKYHIFIFVYEGSMMLGIIDKTEYEIMINTINSFYEGW